MGVERRGSLCWQGGVRRPRSGTSGPSLRINGVSQGPMSVSLDSTSWIFRGYCLLVVVGSGPQRLDVD